MGCIVPVVSVCNEGVTLGVPACCPPANLPISVILVWITNPITIPPILLIAYKIGALIIGPGDDVLSIGSDFDFISGTIKVWKPVLIGSLIMSVVSSFIGYLIVSIYWRVYVSSSWHNRKKIK